MATGPGFPASTNVRIPTLEQSGRIITGFSRNPKKFPVNEYVQFVKTDSIVGLFMRLSPQEAGRFITPQSKEWPDGQPRPMHQDGGEQFNMVGFRCHRYDYGWTLGWLTRDQAEWDIVGQHTQIYLAQAMTHRTQRLITQLTTSTNWTVAASGDFDLSVDHYAADAQATFGGYIDQGTSTAPYFKILIDKIANVIQLDTLGVVEPNMDGQLMVVMNPNTARLLAESPEIHEYIKGSPAALDEIRSGTSPNARYGPGLPSSVYGYKIVVDNTVKVTSLKGATLAKSFVYPDRSLNVVARVGELEGPLDAPNFSTLSLFYLGEQEVALKATDDTHNELTMINVTENVAEVVTSPLSGYFVGTATSKAS